MRRFTLDELLIGGEPHIVDHFLCAVRNAVASKLPQARRMITRNASNSLAIRSLLAAHELLKRHGVNVMLAPALRGPSHDRRRENAAKIQQQVLDLIRDQDAREGR